MSSRNNHYAGRSMEVDGKVESARIAVGASGVLLWGMTLNEWVAIATIMYMVIQILILLPKAYHTLRTAFRVERACESKRKRRKPHE